MKKILLAAALLVSLTTLVACEEKGDHEKALVRPVLSVVLTPVTANATRFTGIIQSRYTSELGFEVAGRLVRRTVSVGDVVTAGQTVAELDPLAYQLQLRIAEAELQSAVAQRDNAATNEAREKNLLSQNVSSQANFDTARQARESADANVESATAKVAKAKERLSNTRIVATFAGVVTEVSVEPGQIVQSGQKVLTLARPDVREAVVDVPEKIGRTLPMNAGFDVVSQAQASLQSIGHVREIAPLADAATRSLRVRITLDDPPPGFRLGTIITATMSQPAQQVLLLPSSAALERDGRTLVWIVSEQGTVSTREVEVAPQGVWLRALKGLSAGERIVTAGVHSLAEGQKVKISDKAL